MRQVTTPLTAQRNAPFRDREKMSERGKAAPPCWSTLPGPALYTIATRLKSLPDYYAFGGACVAWRSVFRDAMKAFMSSQPPLLFRITDDPYPLRGTPRFSMYSHSEDKACQFWIPLPARWTTCVGFQHGYLVMAEGKTFDPLHLKARQALLVHPFTGNTIALPHNPGGFTFAVLSSSPADPACLVLLHWDKSRRVSYCRLGDTEWSTWQCGRRIRRVAAVEKNKFLLVLEDATVAVVDFNLPNGPQVTLEVKTSPPPWKVVASGGELLAFWGPPGTRRGSRTLCRLDLARRTWTRAESLGDQALFLGYCGPVLSAAPAAWGGLPGRVHDCESDAYVGVFSLGPQRLEYEEEESWRRRAPDYYPTVVWVLPSLCF